MALLPPSVPSGTGAGVNELFTLANPATGKFDTNGLLIVTPGNIPPIDDMITVWLDKVAKMLGDNPDGANNLYLIVNEMGNTKKLHWTDIFALSMLADNVQGSGLDFKLRSYKAGNRLFGEADLLKIYKRILGAPGTRDYNSELAALIIEEALQTPTEQGGGSLPGGSGGSSGSGQAGNESQQTVKLSLNKLVPYILAGATLFVLVKKKK